MIHRYSIKNDKKFIEFPYTNKGLEDAKQYRKDHSEFKGRHITDILQAYPSIVYCYREYEINGTILP